MFWLYVINDFEKAIGVDRFSEMFNVTLLLLAFYSVRWWVAGFKIISMQTSTSNYIFIGMLMSSIVFSGSALGRMSAYFLNDVYKVDGKDNSYILKVYNDRVIIAECDISHLKYTLESDLSKYKMTRLQDKEEKLKLRGCLLKHVKNLVV
ncbi:hypothetical protein G5574_03875 [Pantoea stewartii]|uniref:hypothetical protein n=1 Tax=Pantoea stewartii TaxID=66269 RepID=UPI0013DE336A|nr:hypothetical protein [Pantoea stewartii]QIE96159.1 hypothetical protein G5574_03875 [Pantoea stewartii]